MVTTNDIADLLDELDDVDDDDVVDRDYRPDGDTASSSEEEGSSLSRIAMTAKNVPEVRVYMDPPSPRRNQQDTDKDSGNFILLHC